MDALVTVGGQGKRLKRAGFRIPCTKSFIEVQGRPIVYWNILSLHKADFRRVVFCADNREAIERVRAVVQQTEIKDIEFSYVLDDGLGTAGLPFHFMNLFERQFFFITGHSFLGPTHYRNMRKNASLSKISVSTYCESEFAKNIRCGELKNGESFLGAEMLPDRMIDYPYIVDKQYCNSLAMKEFSVLTTLRQYFAKNLINFELSDLPVEIDEPEQFTPGMYAMNRAIASFF